jgi:glutamate dehydrogenase
MSAPRRPALVRAVVQALHDDACAEAVRVFAFQAAADAPPDELPELTTAELAANLADFWRWGAHRRGRGATIRIAPAIGKRAALDRLEILQDDAPFLVDSIMEEIAAQGLSVRAMFHPIVELQRDRTGARGGAAATHRESMVEVFLEKVGADREAALIDGLKTTLADVRAAVEDFPAMLALMAKSLAELTASGHGAEEEVAFLEWLEAEQFVFLGARNYEYPRLANGDYAPEEPMFSAKDGLGVLRDPERTVLRRAHEPATLMGQVAELILNGPALTVAKANARSRVHRRAYMDYIGVKRYGADGKPVGEVRFVGLFTAEAYDEPASAVPLIRAKIAQVLKRAQVAKNSHNEKRLKNILENHPRDELFQVTVDELLEQALGVLHLYDRPRVGMFERRDPLDRFASVLLFVPRDRYNSDFEARAGQILAKAYAGHVSAAYPSFSDAPLARLHYIVGFTPGRHDWPDVKAVEAEIAEAARTWDDRFEAAVRGLGAPPEEVADVLARYGDAFPAGYKDRFDAAEAMADLAVIESFTPDDRIKARAYRVLADNTLQFRFKLYRPAEPAALAEVLPILDNMGLKALAEAGFPITPKGRKAIWVHDFEIEDPRGEHLVFKDIKPVFEEAVVAVWTGRAENDGFNRLVMELSLPWREAALVRALARYRQQTGLDPTQRVQEAALANNANVTRLILELFHVRFDPAWGADLETRKARGEVLRTKIDEALQQVESLDDDRALRRIGNLVASLLRTNFYQTGKEGPAPYIAFKVASAELDALPLPKPYREIFVSAVNVEGIHLRFGPVARGGLRWSDRRDDFRTEVLGLVKAQQVKNAVIVPVGSKGGFFPKRLPRNGAPDEVRAEGVAAYKTFLSGLLDLTDNLDRDGRVIHPQGLIVHDGDDPYLVVAADKGTATFSDIANAVAESYGFWLGDAFASGGSAGYDHKAMGITARGAWEAVKRHFRELGKDVQKEPFTVIGVGDMSGDVFGNGMLLSEQTRLIAAFDHRHIFVDPDPDPKASFKERKRMFALPRSSWDDYDRKVLSKGGGVFARTLKSIPLSPQAKAALDIKADSLTPADLINAILKAPAELLYLGGIGTYVKSRSESNADAGDKANDAVRVNGDELRVKVVGEGANLGVTQAGRIEFAAAGGHIDTDAIDNSAGVDTSDHEVNIKILTGMLERGGALTRKRRDALLQSMTDEVAEHVLAHNYDQTLALSLMGMDAVGELEPHAQFIARLEAQGRLDRAVEGLPDIGTISERAQAGQGLTRPELAVLLAYGKLELKRELLATSAPDDTFYEGLLEAYFPSGLGRYREAMRRHRLRREIIATVVANDIINRCGPSFPWRLMDAAGCEIDAMAAGYEAAKQVLGLPALWDKVSALDGRIPATGQMALYRRLAATLRGATFWLARRASREGLDVGGLVDRYGPGFASLMDLMPKVTSPVESAAIDARARQLAETGAPQELARAAAVGQALTTAGDLIDLARATGWPLPAAARIFHEAGEAFAFDRLRAAAGTFAVGDAFERTALRRLLEDLLAEQAQVARNIMAFAGSAQAGEDVTHARKAVASWAALRREAADGARRTFEEIDQAGGGWTFAKLTIANAALRELAAEGAGKKARNK